jgi:hypothetical protein
VCSTPVLLYYPNAPAVNIVCLRALMLHLIQRIQCTQ